MAHAPLAPPVRPAPPPAASPPVRPEPPRPAPPRSASSGLLAGVHPVALWMSGLATCFTVGFALLGFIGRQRAPSHRQEATTADAAVSRAPDERPASAVPPSGPSPLRVTGARAPLFADVSGVPALLLQASPAVSHSSGLYAAFALEDGRELWRSEVLDGLTEQSEAAVRGDVLWLVTGHTRLQALSVADGRLRGESATDERIQRLCEGADARQWLQLHDGRTVSVAAGEKKARTASGVRCEPARSVAPVQRGDLEDRVDRQAPAGVSGLHCGGVTVMSSAGTYRLPDACAGKLPQGAHEVEVLRLWRAPHGTLGIGTKPQGTSYPRLAWQGRSAAQRWSVDVPERDPIEAGTGASAAVALGEQWVVASFERDQQDWLTAFELGRGARLWTQTLPALGRHVRLTEHQGRLFVGGDAGFGELRPVTGEWVRRYGAH